MNIIHVDEMFTYDDFLRACIEMKKRYEPLLQLETIGLSHDGREIIMFRIGYGRRNAIFTAGVHGRESINPIVCLQMIEHYCIHYDRHLLLEQLDCNKFFRENTLCFIPLLNPDSYMISLFGFDAIRNQHLRELCLSRKIPYSEWKYNARAVDINRNFPAESYRNDEWNRFPASENETMALIRVFHMFPSVGYLDLHSRGRSIFYYRNAMSDEYNHLQKELALKLAEICGYRLEDEQSEIDSGDTGGNTVHYYSENFSRPAITIETIEDEEEFPLALTLREEVFHEMLRIPFEFVQLIEKYDRLT